MSRLTGAGFQFPAKPGESGHVEFCPDFHDARSMWIMGSEFPLVTVVI